MQVKSESYIWTAKACSFAIATMGFATFAVSTAEASWDNLGCAEIGRRTDYDVVQVGRREGAFTKIRLDVTGNDVHFDALRVIYGNGKPDNIKIRSEFREGTKSREIDLKGNKRRIDRIEMISRKGFKGRGRGRAQVCFSGFSPPVRKQRGWEELGCQTVGFARDRDTIRVGRGEGAFTKIRLAVSGNDVFINNMLIVYGNGKPDRIKVGEMLREGTVTRAVDLIGKRRIIRKIDLVYRARPNFNGKARVCVSAYQ